MSVAALVALLHGAGLSACGGDPLPKTAPEIANTTVKLDLPATPKFEVPQPHPDGTHSVREMRLKSGKLLDTEVQVKGYVTWIYDCVRELQKADEEEAAVRKKVEADPSLCQKPHFYIGDTPDTPGERSIWIVDVPRKLRPDERQRMTRDELNAMLPVPDIDLGNEVIVKGKWAKESPSGYTNSDGLLIYGGLENLSNKAEK